MSRLNWHDKYDRDFIVLLVAVVLAIALVLVLGIHSCSMAVGDIGLVKGAGK